jgi:sugar lactone lactonase YvrE
LRAQATARLFTLEYVKTVGGGRKIRPHDMALSRDGRIFVLNHMYGGADSFGVGRIGLCNLDEDFLGEFPDDDGDGRFKTPVAIAFDSHERLYVTDEAKHRVTILSKEGQVLGAWGVHGTADGEIDGPSGLRFDNQDNCYLVDQFNHRVQKFTRHGEFLLKWGEFGDGDGQFNMPWGVCLDSKGYIYVADWRNDRIQKFAPDGTFLAKFGESGRGDGQFDRPSNMVVDDEGYIYVADWGNERVQVLDPNGDFILKLRGEATMSKWATLSIDSNPDEKTTREKSNLYPELPEEFSSPFQASSLTEPYFFGITSLMLDGNGRLYVIDSRRQRFQVYEKSPVG